MQDKMQRYDHMVSKMETELLAAGVAQESIDELTRKLVGHVLRAVWNVVDEA